MDIESNVEIINLGTSVLLWMLIILCILKRTNKIEQNFHFTMVMKLRSYAVTLSFTPTLAWSMDLSQITRQASAYHSRLQTVDSKCPCLTHGLIPTLSISLLNLPFTHPLTPG